MRNKINSIINSERYDLTNAAFCQQCHSTLEAEGVLVLNDFLLPDSVKSIQLDAISNQDKAYFTVKSHTIYLDPLNDNFPANHPRNRQVLSSKGCITTDQIPKESDLCSLYYSSEFKYFLCSVLGEEQLFEYADPLSSINIHYALEGQELGWHFDNSSFAITLLIEKPKAGGVFEYVKNVRKADDGDMNYEGAQRVLDGEVNYNQLTMNPGTLVLFRGRNSMHRVTPTEGDRTRMLAVLAYNSEPNIALSEEARMTFFGRLK